MQTIVTVKLRETYGTVRAYPADEQAERLARLTGAKTLTGAALRVVASMGFAIRRVVFAGAIGSSAIYAPLSAAELSAIA